MSTDVVARTVDNPGDLSVEGLIGHVEHLDVLQTQRPHYDFDSLEKLARACAQSGYFKDASDAAKAYVKVVAGAELGIGPVQAMTGIHIVQGKPTLAAHLIGALIKRSGRYDYRIRKHGEDCCQIEFFEGGQSVGFSEFSMEDAKKAGLASKDVWKSYPRNMLFSRALSNGARWYCPDVFGGSVYTPDELDAAIDGESGEIIVEELGSSDRGADSDSATARTADREPERGSDDKTPEGEAPTPGSSTEGPAEGGEPGANSDDASGPSTSGGAVDSPPAASSERLITNAQRARLFAIADEAGVDDVALREVIREVTGATTSNIPLRFYDAVVTAVQGAGT